MKQLDEAPGIAVDPTPLISEVAGSVWSKLLALASGWLIAHTSLSPDTINSWSGDTQKILISLTLLGVSQFLSWRKLKKAATARAILAEVVKNKR